MRSIEGTFSGAAFSGLPSRCSRSAERRRSPRRAGPRRRRSQARVLGNAGIGLANGGDCANAIAKLEAAEKLYHAVTTLVPLGECYLRTGRVVAGTEALLQVTRELVPSGAAFANARARAERELPAAEARIAKLTLHLRGAPASKAEVAINGTSLPVAMLDLERPTDPGAITIRVSADGYLPAVETLTLSEGEARSVTITLVLASPEPAPDSPSPRREDPKPDAASPSIPTLTWASYGVGAAGLVLGGVFGALALNARAALLSRCPSATTCPASEQSDVRALTTDAWLANAGFALALLGAGVGTYALLTAGTPSNERSKNGFTLNAYVSPFAAGIGGVFQ